MASETTAAAAGAVGVVRRDPMAMLPFCGYNMGDYFSHWIDMGKKITNKPLIFNINWFRLDKNGDFIWPGFGDNFRILKWILDRCEGKVEAVETPIGYLPKPEDIDLTGMDMTVDDVRELLSIDENIWREEVADIERHLARFDRLPDELNQELTSLKKRFGF